MMYSGCRKGAPIKANMHAVKVPCRLCLIEYKVLHAGDLPLNCVQRQAAMLLQQVCQEIISNVHGMKMCMASRIVLKKA